MGKVIPEDVHDRCVEEAERMRQANKLLRGAIAASDERLARAAVKVWGDTGACYSCDTPDDMADELLALRLDLAHTEALLIAEHGELEYTQEMLQSADDTAENLQSERDKYRAALRAPDGELWADLVARLMRNYEAALAESAGLRACLDRIEERATGAAEYRNPPSYGRDYAAYWRDVVREERARAEGKPAEGGK
jgi:hypothetical protein